MNLLAQDGPQQFGYWACAAAFLLAAAWSALSASKGAQKWLMATGCATTAGWALVMALAIAPTPAFLLGSIAEIVRDIAWIAFAISMQGFSRLTPRQRSLAWPLAFVAAAGCVIGLIVLASHLGGEMGWQGARLHSVYPEILLSIFALVLIENLYRNSDVDGRWGIKTLCLGLGLIFVFDFVSYADALFAGTPHPIFLEGRGWVDTLAVPLLLLSVHRSRRWRSDFRFSRGVVFHSAVLLGGGVYLLTMATLGIVLHLIGGWPALQMAFLIATALAMLVVFSSKSFRSTIRVYISKNFFHHKYDYREVWLKFTRDMSLRGQDGDLGNRIVHAVADIFDSPAGALWVLQPDGESFVPSARWNLGDDLPSEPTDGSLARYLAASRWIVNVPEYRRDPARYQGLVLPPWLEEHSRVWLLAPLIRDSKLQGFLALGTPRAAVEITWEELDLLKTIGEQAASYLAEEQASRALAEATRLEDFNRWSAFLVHDIKGIVGQMSLLVANAEKHAHDHAFQRDVVATVASAVQRMRKMLEQLKAGQGGTVAPNAPNAPVDASALLRQVGDRWRRSIPSLQIADADRSVLVEAREDSLVSVLDNLIQNAFEATGPSGQIKLALRRHGGEGMLEVQDDGPGMDPLFVQNELFKPLRTKKANGFGLGAFQVNQLVRAMGGRLEVDTAPGVGTTMRVHLPISSAGAVAKIMDRKAV